MGLVLQATAVRLILAFVARKEGKTCVRNVSRAAGLVQPAEEVYDQLDHEVHLCGL